MSRSRIDWIPFKVYLTITAEVLVHSLADFYCREYADKHMNLWFLRCVNKRLSPCGSTATLTMLWRNSSSIAGQTSENCLQCVKFTIYITFVTCCHYYNPMKQQLTFSIVVTLKGLIFFTYLLAKLLSKSLLSDSSISQTHSKLYFKSTNHNLEPPKLIFLWLGSCRPIQFVIILVINIEDVTRWR